MRGDEEAPVFTVYSNGQTRVIGDGDGGEEAGPGLLGYGKRFCKIVSKKGGIAMTIEEAINESTSKDIVFKCSDDPHPDFSQAMQALAKLVRYILGLPENFAAHSLTVSHVSFSFGKSETKGVVISGYVNLDTANSPFFFNTPYLAYWQANEGGNEPLVPGWGQELLRAVEREAAEYLKGKRTQMNLPLEYDD